MPDYFYEQEARKEGFRIICGIDEAGRGPWAGPVMAAAVVIDPERLPDSVLAQLDDSKKIKKSQHRAIFESLRPKVDFAVGQATVEEIDDMNILQATFLAMRRAVEALPGSADFALVDGNKIPQLSCPAQAIVKGDSKSFSIAAASIIAKVSRDSIMDELAEQYPGYGWERNAGYGTAEHQRALLALGVTPAHRKSYAPIRKILGRVTP